MKKRKSKGKGSKGKNTMSSGMGSAPESDQTPTSLYTVNIYYGGSFVHVPMFSYTSTDKKVIEDVDLQNVSVDEVKDYAGDVLGEFDSLFFHKVNGIVLLSDENIEEIIELSRGCGNVCTLYAYHVAFFEYYGGCSDEEFEEIRRSTRFEKERIEQYEEHANNEEYRTEDESDGNEMYAYTSEESDEEACYAQPPPDRENMVCVDEVFNENTPGKDIKWRAGLVFTSKEQLKEAVRSNSMASGRPYQYIKNDLKRVQIGCAHGCPFKMWVSYIKEREGWQIKTVNNEHSCVWNYKNNLVTVQYLANKYGDRIRKNPNWKLNEMQEEFKRVLKVDVNEAKCCRVRQRALRAVEDTMKEHYAKIRRFGGEILRSNIHNTVKIKTSRLQEGDESRFQRMYVCYGGLKRAWKTSCRPILGLDGCFLKTVCGGQLLSAVGRDGNNCILPVAMAVVESENYESWKWFLELLIADLDLADGREKTLISDQQKGLDKAIRELLPEVEHRFCTRHLCSNLKGKYPSELVKDAFWKASTATHPQAFKIAMKALERASKGAYEKMNQLDPGAWSKAFFKTFSKADSTENNMSECFNSWIMKARYMPIIDMLTEIHDMIMTRMHQKRDWMKQKNCVIVPRVKKLLDDAIKESAGFSVLWDGMENYVVKGHGSSVSVSLKNRTCSCRVWELTGVPCTHAVTAIQESRQNPLDFIEKWYTKESYLKTYSHTLEVIKGEEFWEDVMGDLVLPPLIVKKLRGRPKKARRREGWEGSVSSGKRTRMSYTGRKMHCGYCREEGHKKPACPKKEIYEQEAARKAAQSKKRCKSKKQQQEPLEEVDEVHLQHQEKETGEADLMNEVMVEMEENVRLDNILEVPPSVPTSAPNNAMKFMPTPSLRQHTGNGCTPPASTPPGPSKKKTPRKRTMFLAPRKK